MLGRKIRTLAPVATRSSGILGWHVRHFFMDGGDVAASGVDAEPFEDDGGFLLALPKAQNPVAGALDYRDREGFPRGPDEGA